MDDVEAVSDQELLARYDQTRASLLAGGDRDAMLAHINTLKFLQERFPGEDFLHSRCETLLGRDPKSQEK